MAKTRTTSTGAKDTAKASAKSTAKSAKGKSLSITALRHREATRKNIPAAEMESVMADAEKDPIPTRYPRRNRDLDPQLMWRGKDEQDWSDLIVPAPPLYIQEKVHPQVLIEDLRRISQLRKDAAPAALADLFADFNGLHDQEAKTEFYAHDQNWTNRMILGDSLQVMASLATRESLRGQVQCIYLDPPYGIKFNSNFQWSTTSRDVKDGKADHITREPEQVKAFRDTWRDGIHSYLTYLRDRLTVARDLLTDSGSIFVQIGDENVHRIRALMDEVFGEENCCGQITFYKTTSQTSNLVGSTVDYILWFAKSREHVKYRQVYREKTIREDRAGVYTWVQLPDGSRRRMTSKEKSEPELLPDNVRIFRLDNMTSQSGGKTTGFPVELEGKTYISGKGFWKTNEAGVKKLIFANRAVPSGSTLAYIRFINDFAVYPYENLWTDTGTGSFTDDKVYVVQTATKVIQRCILMSTDPGDLVLDPTCGSGTTAYVAEQWGRRWITIDTSRVALALARSRIMGARYPFYILADSPEGQRKEGEVTKTVPRDRPTHGNLRLGFVYERVPHITLKSIANNAEIDVIWDKWQATLEPLRQQLNKALGQTWEEWQIPREADAGWKLDAKKLHGDWWAARINRQREIDASIAAKAEFEYLFDKPYTDNTKVRVAGPFTVESLSPHKVYVAGVDDELAETMNAKPRRAFPVTKASVLSDFGQMVLENLRIAGVQYAHRQDRIAFTSVTGWPGQYICGEARYLNGKNGTTERRAGIFIGPEYGIVSRGHLVEAVREAGEAGFDVVIACAFNFDAHATEFEKLGRVTVIKARMNADLHMSQDLKNTGGGNLFVVFGEPDIQITAVGKDQLQVKILGIDMFKPQSGEVESSGPEGIALWLIDTDYNVESFFVRHAYFLGANDPYKALKTTLKAEIDLEAWESLHSDTSRPFPRPKSGYIAVKVINHLGDEVMKVFKV